jgi:UDP-glucose 4-epimerase
MGGQLGTRVANLLEDDSTVTEIMGVDVEPPRRRLARAEFHRVDPRNRSRVTELVHRFRPEVVVHLGTYEPNARSTPRLAIQRTSAGTLSLFDAALEAGSLRAVVVRSGIEVYGRRPGSPRCPDEEVAPAPSSAWGHVLAHTEHIAREAGAAAGVPVTALRFAPLVGPHFPSPLGRLLRLPAVPFAALSDPPFSILHQDDAARAAVAALHAGFDGPVNVVGPGAVTASQAARLGGRVPVPIGGPGWRVATALAELAGAPVPEHVRELLVKGRTASGSLVAAALGTEPLHRTPDVVEHLFEWSDVVVVRQGASA